MPLTLTRSLLTVLIPGLIAIAPWLLMLVQHTDATLGFGEYTTLANALVFASAAVAGSFFEAQGSKLEVTWDTEREDEFNVTENWLVYLSREFDREPVAYRYLSRLVTALYAELAMMFAAPLFLGGAAVLASLRFPDGWLLFAIVGLVAVVASGCYFHRAARLTHKVLCETRRDVNARLEEKRGGDTE